MTVRARSLEPIPDPKGGRDFCHRFRRSGYRFALDVWFSPTGGEPWLTVALWFGGDARPSQPAFTHQRISNCYLSSGPTHEHPDADPALYMNGTGFALRADEYAALKASLLPLGLVHHIHEVGDPPAPSAVVVFSVARASG